MLAAFVLCVGGLLAGHARPRLAPRSLAKMSSAVPAAEVSSAVDPAAEARLAVESLWNVELCAARSILAGDSDADQTSLGVRISRDSTITKLWDREDWARHMDGFRFFRHVLFWPRSTVVRSLFPTLCVFAGWTCVVSLLKLSLPLQALALSASPLALLLAFRVNSATARFSEARTQWGRAVLHARDAASIIATMHNLSPTRASLCCRLLCSYGWAMKAVLRSESSLRSVLDALLPEQLAAWVHAHRKPPLAILSLLRQITADVDAPYAAAQSLTTCISDLNGAYGGMERIYSTPLSPTYMRHTTRGLLLWLLMLPAGLLGSGVGFVHTLISVVATSYIMLGIEVTRTHLCRVAPRVSRPCPSSCDACCPPRHRPLPPAPP
jgi:predicted membrane chloride channel (bestrophin family)